MDVELDLSLTKGIKLIEGAWEKRADENIWT